MELLLAYYGDDFTGSADVMEVLQWAGLRTVLFLEPPTLEQLESFDGLRAYGVAGWSRTMSPDEMERELKPALASLHASGAQFIHYKTCSTADSSPQIGSLGKALELGRQICGTSCVPILIAAPHLGRYQVFGNLFARSGLDSEPFRLDRHPTMRHHPTTPMQEADMREHLRMQTNLNVALLDILELETLAAKELLLQKSLASDAVLLDALYEQHLRSIGSLLPGIMSCEAARFVMGSSGVEQALLALWEQSATIASARSDHRESPTFAAVEQLLVLTGSCSPVNDRQIAWAQRHGFATLELHPSRLIDPLTCQAEIEQMVQQAVEILSGGSSLIMHSARGPSDPRVEQTLAMYRQLGLSDAEIRLTNGRRLGPQLGEILKGVLSQTACRRVGIAGGDTSGYVARTLGLTSLEAIAPLAPGSPLCRAYANNALNGIEVMFKGGQVGRDDVWGTMLHGTKEVSHCSQ